MLEKDFLGWSSHPSFISFLDQKQPVSEKKLINWTSSILKNLCISKDTNKKIKRQVKDWRKNLQNTNLIKDFYPYYEKHTYNSIIRKQTTQWPNGQKKWLNISSKKVYEGLINTWKDA